MISEMGFFTGWPGHQVLTIHWLLCL